MDSFLKVKTKDIYELVVSSQNPDVYFEVYKIDYLKEKDLLLYNDRIENPNVYHPRVLKIDSKNVLKGSDAVYQAVVIEHTPFRLEEIGRNI